MKAAVVGIGRVGLPLAVFFASRGVYTYGVDVDAKKIDMLREGRVPFREKGLEEVVFDRGGYPYHGRVKAVADAAREKGLKF